MLTSRTETNGLAPTERQLPKEDVNYEFLSKNVTMTAEVYWKAEFYKEDQEDFFEGFKGIIGNEIK